MRKRLITAEDKTSPVPDAWLNLDSLADVEVTSEQSEAPIESALLLDGNPGWRASSPGLQTVRLCFLAPQNLRRIQLCFVEETSARVQEFVLRWLPAGGTAYREIVRQQYGFSPPGTTQELEDYTVDLKDAVALELSITPEISGGLSPASLKALRLA